MKDCYRFHVTCNNESGVILLNTKRRYIEMNQQIRSILEILKRPDDYSVERVSRALTEILEITGEFYQAPAQPLDVYALGGVQNG